MCGALWSIFLESDESVRPLFFSVFHYFLRGEATPADSLDVQVLALKTGSDFCLEGKGYEKGQMGLATSEMRDLDFHLFTVKLNRTAWGPGMAFSYLYLATEENGCTHTLCVDFALI